MVIFHISLNLNEKLSFDQLKVADKFNTFFTSVAVNLVEKLPIKPGLYDSDIMLMYYSQLGVVVDSFGLTQDNVLRLLNDLKCSKATGQDEIPARFLEDAAEYITPYLIFLIL